MKYELKVEKLEVIDTKLKIRISGEFIDSDINKECLSTPKVILYFDNGIEDRRIPFVIRKEDINFKEGKCMFHGEYTYYLNVIFWKTRNQYIPFKMYFNLSFRDFYQEKVNLNILPEEFSQDKNKYSIKIYKDYYIFERKKSQLLCIPKKLKLKTIIKLLEFCILNISILFIQIFKYIWMLLNKNQEEKTCFFNASKITRKYKSYLIKIKYEIHKHKKIQSNKITFYSTRRDDISGNFKFVYDEIKNDNNIDIRFLYNTKFLGDMTNKEINDFIDACSTSKVIVLDEYTPQIHLIKLKPETKIIQLWHACGAFKTFGFSRLGKPKGSPQNSNMHRSYDYVTVSSDYCRKCHSEGFGLSTKNIVPTGIARTDIFFDSEYKTKVRDKFYKKYPNFKNKKVILFAPTFRGDLKEDANYPMELFDIKNVCDFLGEEYYIIIKHHPFIKEKHYIPEEYRDRVIDLSDNTEINDLLFIANVVITDYSSIVFECSLLNLPMIFYTYDLKEYIESRDFYFDYKYYIPGKICFNLNSLLETIKKEDYDLKKMVSFRNLFFDDLDGKASKRIANLIYKALKEI